MFLLPAVGSFAADSLVIFVHSRFRYLLEPKEFWSIQNTTYLPPLSVCRLLLLLPLNYHVYSGTRLKFTALYTVFHTASALVILAHFFAFGIVASESFSDFYVPSLPKNNDLFVQSSDTVPNDVNLDEEVLVGRRVPNDIQEYDLIWILLTLSLFSIGLHVVILLHVRSTAPTNDAMKRKFEDTTGAGGIVGTQYDYSYYSGRKRLGYWIYNQYRKGTLSSLSLEEEIWRSSQESSQSDWMPCRRSTALDEDRARKMTMNHRLLDDSEHSDLESGISLESASSDVEMDPFIRQDYFRSAVHDTNHANALGHDNGNTSPRRGLNRRKMSAGVNLGKLIGIEKCFSTTSSRGGYFMGEIRARFIEAKREWASRLDDFTSRMRQDEHGVNAKIILPQFHQNSPFRILLQMYAHEEVFRDDRLDRAFPIDDTLALSFYAPQMLSFLLHNAFWMTGKLEKWVLDRCKIDIYFAHRCFWFLRAWCLQGGIFIAHKDLETLKSRGKTQSDEMGTNSRLMLDHSDHCPEPDFSTIKDLVKDPSQKDLEKSNGIKFSSEERKELEMLLAKIVESGECAARRLEFQYSKATAAVLKEEEVKNNLSMHSNCGVIPHSTSSLRLNDDGEEVRSFFLRTPDFLDSLISIADDLLLEPISSRTSVLRTRLKELESSMLPSNSIYVPVHGCLHRVCKISTSECVALSTKERVPCIIYLEVLDISSGQEKQEDLVLKRWFTSPRPPRRLHTLLSQVEKIAQRGLKKLRDDFEESQEKIFSRMNNSMLRSNSTEVYLSAAQEDSASKAAFSFASNFSSSKNDVHSANNVDASPLSGYFSQASSDGTSATNKLGQWLLTSSDYVAVDCRDSPSSYGSTELPILPLSDLSDKQSEAFSPRSPLVVFKESWREKEERIRRESEQGTYSSWRLLPILIKSNDDLRQEQLASQLIRCMASILAAANVPAWLYPYDIVALSFRGGVIEAIPDTISIDSLRKNHPHFTNLKHFFKEHFGNPGTDSYENAKANFVESLAAYSIVCFLLQIKDRHNGNILLDNKGHIVHIDFGFLFLSSPGKNSGFESAPFKLTAEFIEVMDGVNSHTFSKFREICYKTFIELRRNCFQITLLVQMLLEGNEDLDCFRGRPHDAIQGLQERFRLDMNDRACQEYVNSLIDDSIGNWTTTCYDRYQRWFTGVL